ncbi:MAG: hypothetical protein QHJ73_14960 [Armatimonadota bacterium]|nr:hypothetical protein [Armatimonadota bacterium]
MMSSVSWRDERGIGGVGIVGILVVTAILVYLAVQMIPTYTGAGRTTGPGAAPPGKAMSPQQRAHSVECRQYLSQIRQAIAAYAASNEQRPTSLSQLSSYGVSSAILVCPISRQPYVYDPRTGRVGCRTPGHEGY